MLGHRMTHGIGCAGQSWFSHSADRGSVWSGLCFDNAVYLRLRISRDAGLHLWVAKPGAPSLDHSAP